MTQRLVPRSTFLFLASCLLAAGLFSTGSMASPSGSGLFVVNPDGTGLRTVVDGCVESFSWSPDGNSIAYVRLLAEDDPADATEVIDLRTSARTRLMNEGYSSPPSWSPDSQRVAFGGRSDVFVAAAKGRSTPKRITGGQSGYWPDWSPDGRRVAYDSFSGRVVTVTPSGASPRYLTAEKSTDLATAVLWLPDGKRLLYLSDADPNLSDKQSLMVVSVSGGTARAVASPSSGIGRRYDISPRGDQVAYTSENEDAVYLVRPDGTGTRRLPWVDIGGWSPDGKQMLMVASDRSLWIADSRGKARRKIAPRVSGDGFYIGQPLAAWSSKGRIAYMYTDGSCGGPS